MRRQLRFPEISIAMKRLGCDILTYPSAFTVPTGKAHWEPLLRARAIETQSYVIAAAQVGRHNEKRQSYGHSMIIDPWGVVLADLGETDDGEPRLATAKIDPGLLQNVRTEMPLLRRTYVFARIALYEGIAVATRIRNADILQRHISRGVRTRIFLVRNLKHRNISRKERCLRPQSA
jgi:hypothetical protein